jgi:CheY-like chemotaxis protein
MVIGLGLAKDSGTWGEDRELLELLEGSCHRAAGLVKQLLAFSSQSIMDLKSLDLAGTVERKLELCRSLLGEGIELKFTRSPALSRVRADQALLEQVLRNLCQNAQEAMKHGGVLRVDVSEEAVGKEREKAFPDARAGQFVRLTVSDSGCGMDEKTVKRLFEPFFTTKSVVKGAGLSLASVQGIVRQHRGWVEVESRVDQGSTFRVYLPAEVRPADTLVAAQPAAPVRGGRRTILLVEDEEVLRKVTRKLLARMGYQVLEAADGAAALEVWAAHEAEIDMIFTDMVMPGELSGLDVVQQVMGKKPGLKAIITSGYNMEKADLEAARTSGILYLPKPWAFEELAEIMGAMLGSGVAPTSQSNAVRI